MATRMYSEEDIREMLKRAYPQKSEDEIEDMVEDTMEQYLQEMKKKTEEEE